MFDSSSNFQPNLGKQIDISVVDISNQDKSYSQSISNKLITQTQHNFIQFARNRSNFQKQKSVIKHQQRESFVPEVRYVSK